ncbi:MAG: cation diffusion facilitator family transporter [gamma proteobacterium symbiont of Bathyaustriella thionipta]|nr:cation diffusion facilitator family transporter [gamma proteobacterium symbiont of Bathyaustriella thionipta]MCU7949734.1 cation diffusion facilitator family transporter [gamma proteobacterium symbiont of Bathyaustriella thionipta]MCU7952854.1 cation diffusion facilitator family transporter [gamma proteobacterium symbiont of Bathyaustriella thionipta]MCU7956316.1 cation diffusion facilitator family transporter [gamma proteobacterium symbiont of Bathyaustriella thionipta]MCU7968472.1 cation d
MPHNHDHQHKNYNKAFAIGVFLNVVFVVIEAFYGFVSGSLALLADAGHNLSDVLGLLLAWGASYLASKSATEKRTYGYRKITVIASVASAILLLVALGGIVWEAIGRLNSPQPIASVTVIVVALIGVVINTITALLFVSDQHHDLNIRGAYLHMAADAGISLGVAVAGLIIWQTNWVIIDPLISIFIVIIILVGTWGLLRDSFNLSIDAVPKNIDMPGIKHYLSELEEVHSIHDLHVWAISTTVTALSVHLVVTTERINNEFLDCIQTHLKQKYHIEHTTIQLELESETPLNHDPSCH